jgi:hypothetical protein
MCDTLVRVLPDRVLFGKNSDREADEPQALFLQPRRQNAPGSRLRCTHIEIPEAETTYAVLLSRPVWCFGAEMGVNEHGVAIGNEAVFTRHAVPKSGLTGMDLVRLGLERSRSAEEAVQVIVRLHEAHGQGGRCGYEDHGFRYFSSFLVADGAGAFVLETAGRAFAVERVKGARSISNGLTIPGFAESHGDFLKTRVAEARARRACTQAGAAGATSLADLARVLRHHGDESEWPSYAPHNGAMRAPCMHAGGLFAASQTTASFLVELRPGSGNARCFATGTSAPCLSLWKPVPIPSGDGSLPAFSFGPTPGAEPDDSLWWRHERLHRLTMRDPARLAPLFLPERDALQKRFFDDAAGLDPQAAWDEAAAALDRFTARVAGVAGMAGMAGMEDSLEKGAAGPAGRDVRPFFARRYWRRRRPV